MGYARLARAISEAQMAGEKGAPRTTVDALAAAARAPVHLHPAPSAHNDAWYVLTGCRKGTVPAALVRDGPAAARGALERLVAGFGRERVLVELWDHGDPIDRHRNDAFGARGGGGGSRRDRHQQRALRDPSATPAGHRARRGAGPSFARRDRWLAPRVSVRPPPQRRGAGASFRSLAGCGGAHRRDRERVRVRPAPGRARAPRPRRAGRSHRDDLAARAHRTRRADPVSVVPCRPRAGVAPDRPRAGRDRAAQLPRLLPGARRHRRVLSRAHDIYCQGRGARPTARSATRSGSPRPTPSRWTCSSSVSSRSNATVPPTSTSTSSTSGARR